MEAERGIEIFHAGTNQCMLCTHNAAAAPRAVRLRCAGRRTDSRLFFHLPVTQCHIQHTHLCHFSFLEWFPESSYFTLDSNHVSVNLLSNNTIHVANEVSDVCNGCIHSMTEHNEVKAQKSAFQSIVKYSHVLGESGIKSGQVL